MPDNYIANPHDIDGLRPLKLAEALIINYQLDLCTLYCIYKYNKVRILFRRIPSLRYGSTGKRRSSSIFSLLAFVGQPSVAF